MKSKDLLKEAFKPRTKEKSVASLFIDTDGTTYSYGLHYPLLFEVNGLKFRNTQGYSSTTGKHISYAGIYADYDVKLTGSKRGKPTADYVLECLKKEHEQLLAEEQNTKRKNTQKYEYLISDIGKVQSAIKALT